MDGRQATDEARGSTKNEDDCEYQEPRWMTVSIWLQSCPFLPPPSAASIFLLLLPTGITCFPPSSSFLLQKPCSWQLAASPFLPSFPPCRHQFRTGSLLCPSIALGSSRGEAPLDSDFSKPHRACRLQLPAPHNLRLPYCAIPSHYPPCNTDLNLCARSLGDLQVAV